MRKAIKGGGIAFFTEGRILTSDGCAKGTMAMRKEESKMARPRKRNRKENRFSIFLAVIVVILLTTMVGFKSIGLKQKSSDSSMRGKSFFGTNKKTFSGSTEKVFCF